MAGASIVDGKVAPHVVLSWGNHPGYIPPPQFSPNQTTLCSGEPGKGPRYDTGRHVVHGWTGGPGTDLGDALRAAGRTGKPDLIVVATDLYKKNRMRGLEAFGCPKLLLVGDTHHGPRPLEMILTYAQSEKFEAIAIQFNLQHAHWFRTAGFERIAWVPGLTAHLCKPTEPTPRPAIVSFAGQTGPVFPRRTRLFAALREAGLPAFHFEVPRPDLEHVLRASPITFNCSVNGDLNLRLFEAASAGSLVITDRLSDRSGFERLFEPGVECALYDTPSELLDLCRYYLRRPQEAATIAERARKRTSALASNDRLAEKLAVWALGEGPAPFQIDEDPRSRLPRASITASLDDRLAIYQIAQLLHVERESPLAFIGAGCPAVSALDMTDLPRLRLVVAKDRNDVRTLLDDHGFASRYTVAERPDASTDWDLWLDRSPVAPPPAALSAGTIAPFADLAGVATILNGEALQRYKTPAEEPGLSTQHAITSLSGPHGPLNLVMPRSRETSDTLKRIFGDRPYSPYPSVHPNRLIVHIGADAALAASFFRPSFPDATILCFDDDPERLHLLIANAAALGNCRVFGKPLTVNGIASPALADDIVAAQEEIGVPEIDIVTLDTAGRSAAVVEGFARILPTVRSLFVNCASTSERAAVAGQLEPTHAPWRPQLEDTSPLFRRYIRRDLSSATKPANPDTP